ncbi:MAG: helix-turn-helix domain-containing protein [Bacteroidetes bacterium]|nr:helix-turn-helix domain-containing protein [Bacteroidota bacterium]
MPQSLAGRNLKYLRKSKKLTQEEFAARLNIKRSLLGAYEEDRAEPRLDVLEAVSDWFGISLDDLLRTPLGAVDEASGRKDTLSYLLRRRMIKMAPAENLIHFVPVKAAAGYLAGYADEEFIDELNTFTLPMLGGGQYRAFEIIGDSMLPTPSGSVIVGQKIPTTMQEVQNNHAYIVISRSEGIVYKRILKDPRQQERLTLVSDNPAFKPYFIHAGDILELWQAQMVISKVAVQQRWDMGQLASMVTDLQEQVSSLKRKMN